MNLRKRRKAKTHRLAILLCLFTVTTLVQPKPTLAVEAGDIGLGLVIGSPYAGISLKLWQENDAAVAATLGWGNDYFRFQADYIKHRRDMIKVEVGKASVYYGAGIYFQDWRSRNNNKHNQVGIRAPLGLNYELASEPIEFFVEVAPTITLVDGSGFDIDGGLGGRYYF